MSQFQSYYDDNQVDNSRCPGLWRSAYLLKSGGGIFLFEQCQLKTGGGQLCDYHTSIGMGSTINYNVEPFTYLIYNPDKHIVSGTILPTITAQIRSNLGALDRERNAKAATVFFGTLYRAHAESQPRLRELQTKLAASEKDRIEYQRELQNLTRMLKEAQEQKDVLDKAVESNKQTMALFQKQQQDLTLELRKQIQGGVSNETQVKKLTDDLVAIEEQIRKVAEERGVMDAAKDHTTTPADRNRVLARIAQLSGYMKKLETDYKAAVNNRDAQGKQLAEAKAEIERLAAAQQELNQQLEKAGKNTVFTQTVQLASQEKVKKLEEAVTATHTELEDANRKIEAQQTELGRLKRQQADASAELLRGEAFLRHLAESMGVESGASGAGTESKRALEGKIQKRVDEFQQQQQTIQQLDELIAIDLSNVALRNASVVDKKL